MLCVVRSVMITMPTVVFFSMMGWVRFVMVLAGSMRRSCEIRHLRVGITHFCQVCGPRPRIQISEYRVVARVVREFGDSAVRVRQISEGHTVRGANLLAGRADGPIRYLNVFGFQFDVRTIQARA